MRNKKNTLYIILAEKMKENQQKARAVELWKSQTQRV